MELRFTIQSIEIVSKQVSKAEFSSGKMDFKVNTKHAVFPNEKHVSYVGEAIFFTGDQVYVSLEIMLVFFIENFEEVFNNTDGKIPVDIDVILRSLVIGTLRGVFFSEFSGTRFRALIIPPIIPNAFVQNEQAGGKN